jgi:hypothetical protein
MLRELGLEPTMTEATAEHLRAVVADATTVPVPPG